MTFVKGEAAVIHIFLTDAALVSGEGDTSIIVFCLPTTSQTHTALCLLKPEGGISASPKRDFASLSVEDWEPIREVKLCDTGATTIIIGFGNVKAESPDFMDGGHGWTLSSAKGENRGNVYTRTHP